MSTKCLISLTILGVMMAGSTVNARPSDARCHGRQATIVGTGHSDSLVGTPGNDVIAARGGSDSVDGKGGRDLICGGRGNDFLLGGRDDDRLFGEAGDDTFKAGQDRGDDELDGGPGADLLMVAKPSGSGEPSGSRGPAQVDLAAGTAVITGAGTNSLALGTIENVYGTGMGDEIHGDAGDNVLDAGYFGGGMLEGRGGDDILRAGQDGDAEMLGGPGDDELVPLNRDNIMDGGDGSDTVVACAGLDVTVDLSEGRSVFHHPDGDEVSSVTAAENALTCHGNDTLIGDDGPNVLVSRAGDDRFEGRGGDDTIDGRGDEDTADGGDGTDSCARIETASNCES